MADYPSHPRPGMPIPKPTQHRYAKAHQAHVLATESQNNSNLLTLDTLIISLGYASFAGYLYHSARKFSPWELAGLTIGAASVGFGLFDYGSRKKAESLPSHTQHSTHSSPGSFYGGSSLPPSRLPSRQNSLMGSVAGSRRNSISSEIPDDSWKGPYQHRPFITLSVEEKKELLDMEEAWISSGLEEKQLLCGQAYIAKEKSYVAYEKHGHYGGQDWKKFVEADKECKEMYKAWKKGEERLMYIEAERVGLNESS